MTMTATDQPGGTASRVQWPWLWGAKRDLSLNLAPFWMGFALILAVALTPHAGVEAHKLWSMNVGGHTINLVMLAFVLYGPFVDGPHLWATIARTYTDSAEWAARRKLFITALLAFAVGPALILAPYAINAVVPLPAAMLGWGWTAWVFGFGAYALYHINKQHWGFVSLYRRKNGDADPGEARVDALFFNTAIWLPWIAMQASPWPGSVAEHAPAAIRTAVFTATHAVFLGACAAYALYQVVQWRKGRVRNGTKLLYIGTVIALYYLTFAFDPVLASLWILITSTGHCVQYHGVVWAYGRKHYAVTDSAEKRLPQIIFGNLALYAGLGVLYALFTLQGPGAERFKTVVGGWLESGLFSHLFATLSPAQDHVLAIQALTAFISGVRLHHFYVDSKIWRVSKSRTLAKDLSV